MPTRQTDYLIQLIQSLSKSEKRNFRLYADRNKLGGLKFFSLFEVLDKIGCYDEDLILKKIPEIKKSQLSNLKANLHQQLLTSLRLSHVKQDQLSGIREQVDFARLVFNKGLYKQSLAILDKACNAAKALKNDILVLEITEFEKLIESRYITRSSASRVKELTNQSNRSIASIQKTAQLSNLALQLYDLYIKVGYARNHKDVTFVKEYYKQKFPPYDHQNMLFHEKLFYYQSMAWYYYILIDFVMYYRYAQKWVNIYSDHTSAHFDVDDYLKGMHNLMTAQFYTLQYSKLCATIDDLDAFSATFEKKTENVQLNFFMYTSIAKINKFFIEGNFKEGVAYVPEIEAQLDTYGKKMDEHRSLVFYYKIACLYFGNDDHKKKILYLNKIINTTNIHLREDLHCFARILNLIAHYEMGNMALVESQIKNVYRFLAKMDELHEVHKEILKFLRKLVAMNPKDLHIEFKQLRQKLVVLKNQPFEQRPFLYLDIIAWLDGKLRQIPVRQVIRENFYLTQKNRS